MKLSTKDIIFTVIIIILLLVILFHKSNPSAKEVLQQHTIDSLSTVIEKKIDTIHKNDKTVLKLIDTIYITKTKILSNDTLIKTIKKNYEIHIDNVDDFDIIQLENFFTERYASDSSQ